LCSDPVEVYLDILMSGAEQRVGRCLVSMHVEDFFDSDSNKGKMKNKRTEDERSTHEYHPVSPDFRFRRLSHSLNWERIRSIPIERVIHNGWFDAFIYA
jgi:hypothetical protein